MTRSAHAVLLEQARHHHALVVRMTSDLACEDAARTLRAGGPSGVWLLRHLCQETDTSLRALVGGESYLSAEHANPTAALPAGPALEAYWRELRETWGRLSETFLERLGDLAPGALELEPAIEVLPEFRASLRTRLDFLRGHLFHLAWHLGQLASLRAGLEPGGAK